METFQPPKPALPAPDDASALVELTGAELTMAAGGLNPQPLPPHEDPEMRI
jgi:hypothetical protein